MSQDAIERRATALQSAASPVDDPAEEAVLGHVRTLLSHPATWASAPDLDLPRLMTGAVDLAPEPASAPTHAPVARPARRPWRARWTTRRWVLALGGAVTAAAAVVAAISFVVAPDRVTTRFDLTGTGQQAEAQASVVATRHGAGWHLTLSIRDLAPAEPDEYYAGWVVSDEGIRVPLGTFHMREPGEVELWAGVDVREYALLEVTVQQLGGPLDGGPLVLAGEIPPVSG